MSTLVLVVAAMAAMAAACPDTRFDARKYGAVGDGVTMNTAAFRSCVAAAAAAGGGRIFVTAGQYKTGTIQLLNNTCLEVSGDASLYASDAMGDYLQVPSLSWDSGTVNYPLIFAANTHGVGLLGTGMINGGANDPPGHLVASYDASTNFLTPVLFSGCSAGYSCRVKLAIFRDSTNVRLENITLAHSPFWTLSFERSAGITVRGVHIYGDRRWPNNDGMDIIGSTDIVIEDANISTGDDSICIVAHTAEATRGVRVRNCSLQSTSAAVKLTTFDPHGSGDITDIHFADIRITDTNRGVALMPRWGAASIRDVIFADVTMETRFFSTPWWGSAEPISVTLVNFSDTQFCGGTIANVSFVNIAARSENGALLVSTGPLITAVVLQNVTIAIARFGNISRPCHDLRPAPAPDMYASPLDGIFAQGVAGLALLDTAVAYEAPCQPFYGSCLNTTNTPGEVRRGFHCSTCSKH